MKEIKAVIFDLDGTLLDTLEDLADSMNHVLAEYGFPERSLSEIRQFVGNGVRRLVERAVCYPNDPKPEQKDLLDRMFASMKAYYESHCNGKTAPYPGIKKTLEQLKQDGLKLGIVSNKLDAAVKELNAVYFADWIPVAVGDRPGCRVKPAADLLQAAVAELGVEPSECLYVGDSEVDVQTAANAGIPCITALWGFRDRDMLEKEGAVVFADTAERLLAKIRERVHFGRSDYRYLLFDLDGTLTNPEEGITKCVQYSLASFGIQAECRDLLKFIGPPLKDSFMDFYGLSEQQAEEAVTKYRERYVPTGIFENFAYAGIRELLRDLKAAGYYLGVATSKPEIMARRVLEKYELAEWFDVVTGCEMDGRRSRKSEVIEETLRRFRKTQPMANGEILMIGDRKFDVLGAKETGLDSVGVYYGFAEPGELEAAGADYVVDTVAELGELLLAKVK